MKATALVFLGQAVAFVLAVTAYQLGVADPVGSVLLGTCAVFGVWVAVYLLRAVRRLPELDDPGLETDVGQFPSATRWTPVLGLGIVLVANGLLAGAWLLVSGAIVLMAAVIGYTFEFSRSSGSA